MRQTDKAFAVGVGGTGAALALQSLCVGWRLPWSPLSFLRASLQQLHASTCMPRHTA